jgi:hypothetical protein
MYSFLHEVVMMYIPDFIDVVKMKEKKLLFWRATTGLAGFYRFFGKRSFQQNEVMSLKDL